MGKGISESFERKEKARIRHLEQSINKIKEDFDDLMDSICELMQELDFKEVWTEKNGKKAKIQSTDLCFKCGQKGHWAKTAL